MNESMTNRNNFVTGCSLMSNLRLMSSMNHAVLWGRKRTSNLELAHLEHKQDCVCFVEEWQLSYGVCFIIWHKTSSGEWLLFGWIFGFGYECFRTKWNVNEQKSKKSKLKIPLGQTPQHDDDDNDDCFLLFLWKCIKYRGIFRLIWSNINESPFVW